MLLCSNTRPSEKSSFCIPKNNCRIQVVQKKFAGKNDCTESSFNL